METRRFHSGRMRFSARGDDEPPSSFGSSPRRRKRRTHPARRLLTGARYQLSGHCETQYEPGSGCRVLKNFLGLRSVREMERLEQRELIRTTALAETHTELLLIHPFRDGNGRLARLLATVMSLQAGVRTPDFDLLLKRRAPEYFAAVQAGLDRNYEPMRTLFASVLDCGGL